MKRHKLRRAVLSNPVTVHLLYRQKGVIPSVGGVLESSSALNVLLLRDLHYNENFFCLVESSLDMSRWSTVQLARRSCAVIRSVAFHRCLSNVTEVLQGDSMTAFSYSSIVVHVVDIIFTFLSTSVSHATSPSSCLLPSPHLASLSSAHLLAHH